MAQQLYCGFQIIDDREIRVNSQADVNNKRFEIIRAIWDTDTIPSRLNVLITRNIKSPVSQSSSIYKVDKFETPVPGSSETLPLKSLAYHFIPVKRNKRLVVYSPGHVCSLRSDRYPAQDQRHEATIHGLLQAGFDVLVVFMPHVSETDCNLDHCEIMKTNLGIPNQKATLGLRFFLEPTISIT